MKILDVIDLDSLVRVQVSLIWFRMFRDKPQRHGDP